jgi:hypothetical protein
MSVCFLILLSSFYSTYIRFCLLIIEAQLIGDFLIKLRTEEVHLLYLIMRQYLTAQRSILRQLFWRAEHEKMRETQFDHSLRSKFSPHRLLTKGASVRQYIGAGVAFLIALSLYRPLPLANSSHPHIRFSHLHIRFSHHLYLPPYTVKKVYRISRPQPGCH